MEIMYHKNGSLPKRDQIFVFASNLRGAHGAGAARQALKYGARFGRGMGLVGQTYAIPTKDADLATLPLDTIAAYVDRFVKFARDHPEVTFFLTAIGTGLAGYSHKDIAPMFKSPLKNISYPDCWKPYLEL